MSVEVESDRQRGGMLEASISAIKLMLEISNDPLCTAHSLTSAVSSIPTHP